MQAPNWTDFLQCSVCTNRYNTTTLLPISLSCGHTICKKCLTEFMARVCPYDKTAISPNAELLPPNSALMWLLGSDDSDNEEGTGGPEEEDFSLLHLSPDDLTHFKLSRASIKSSALFLQPLSEPGGSQIIHYLTRPMLKKLVTVVNCQFLESDGRARVLRAARSITDRTVTELLVMHQNQQQISTLLWSAIRSRGCQFLGPVMQEEALKLILKVLEGGAFLSRKNIVLYVVQQLQQQDFHQASKTCVGHVVQLLYRASCFNVEKRDEDSSRMQLKEESRTYEALRREHDAQIIRVAMEGGLRISPEQWSALLYGDQKHKSDMQSIIDKLLSLGIATSGLSELVVAIRRSQDQHNLLEKIVPHLEKLLRVDINIDKSSSLVQQWTFFSESMAALVSTLQEFSSFMRIQSGRYKTGICPNLTKPGGCPKGEKCTYAHTEEERERYRYLARGAKNNRSRDLGKPVSGPQTIPSRSGNGKWSGDMGMSKLDSSPFSSYDATYTTTGAGSGYPSGGGGGTTTGFEGYTDYSTISAVGNAASIVLQPVVRQQSNMTSDPSIPSHVIPAQPQLVAYRSPHHSGPITVSGELTTAVYDPTHIDHNTYYTTTQRGNEAREDYTMVGIVSDGRQYSATQPPLHHDRYMTTGPPSALESIKQVHADIKRNIEPCNFATNEGGHLQYPPSNVNQVHYISNDGGRFANYPQSVVPTQQLPRNTLMYEQETIQVPSDQRHYHHDNNPGHTPATVVSTDTQSVVTSVYSPEVKEEGEGNVKGSNGLSNQMSQLQLKDPGYYETAPHSNGGAGVTTGYTASSESYPQYVESQSAVYTVTTGQNHTMEPTSVPQYVSVGGDQVDSGASGNGGGGGGPSGVSGNGGGRGGGDNGTSGMGGGDMEAMREKIRLLEAQLAREKMKSTQQMPGPQPIPAHTGLMYGNTAAGYSTQVQQYAPTARVQQVQMYPTVTASFYQTAPATPTYQYSNWSGPQSSLQYSGDLSTIQTVPQAGYVLQTQQPPPQHQPVAAAAATVGRNVYVQPQALAQDDKDHMIAMYLQTLEQSRVQQQIQHPPLQSSHYPQHQHQHHSTQPGYGGGAMLGYSTANHYVPSSATQYVMKPY